MPLESHLDQALLPEEGLPVAGAVCQQRQQRVQAGAGQQPVLHISLQLGQQDSACIPLLSSLPGLLRHQAQDLRGETLLSVLAETRNSQSRPSMVRGADVSVLLWCPCIAASGSA